MRAPVDYSCVCLYICLLTNFLNRETARNRKERLYKVAMDYFDNGKLWEEAIKLIKELRVEYEFTLYDYQKLAGINLLVP